MSKKHEQSYCPIPTPDPFTTEELVEMVKTNTCPYRESYQSDKVSTVGFRCMTCSFGCWFRHTSVKELALKELKELL